MAILLNFVKSSSYRASYDKLNDPPLEKELLKNQHYPRTFQHLHWENRNGSHNTTDKGFKTGESYFKICYFHYIVEKNGSEQKKNKAGAFSTYKRQTRCQLTRLIEAFVTQIKWKCLCNVSCQEQIAAEKQGRFARDINKMITKLGHINNFGKYTNMSTTTHI